MKAKLIRLCDNGKQTIGTLVIFNEKNNPIATFPTLELPYLDNKRKISCIKTGTYNLSLVDSPKFGKQGFYHVTQNGNEVEGRSAIGLHRGNYNTDTQGCILVGYRHLDNNKDGNLDVINSKLAFTELVSIGKEFELEIIKSF